MVVSGRRRRNAPTGWPWPLKQGPSRDHRFWLHLDAGRKLKEDQIVRVRSILSAEPPPDIADIYERVAATYGPLAASGRVRACAGHTPALDAAADGVARGGDLAQAVSRARRSWW